MIWLGLAYREISLLRSVVVPEPLRKTVISAEVSRLLRILDMKSGSTDGGWATEAVEVKAFLLLQPKVRPKSAKVPRLWDSLFAADFLPAGSRMPQSLKSSVSWASELRRRLEVVWEEVDKSSADSIVVICAQELRRPVLLPRRPRIISWMERERTKKDNFRGKETLYWKAKLNWTRGLPGLVGDEGDT